MEWNKPGSSSKYGLQLKITTPAAKKPQFKKPLPFDLEDNSTRDEYSVEDDIARQATKKKYAREVQLQHEQALEQDASVFDYDGVYDEMKGKQAQPIREDRAKREPKYIGKLLQQAKVRAVEHDIAYERNLAKERAKEDHLFPDKEKFVTKAYKQKLVEQGKWLEEERLKEMREQADEVSKKGDMGDFYRNLLSRNVAYGATKVLEDKRSASHLEANRLTEGGKKSETAELATSLSSSLSDTDWREREEQSRRKHRSNLDHSEPINVSRSIERANSDAEGFEEMGRKEAATRPAGSTPLGVEDSAVQRKPEGSSVPGVGRKTKADAVQAAKERYLARKKQKVS